MYETLHILLILTIQWTLSNCVTKCPSCAGDSCFTRECGACLYHLNPPQFPTLQCVTGCHQHHTDPKCCVHEKCIADAFGALYSKTFVNCPVCHGDQCHKVKCIDCKVNTEGCLIKGTCYIESDQCHAGVHEKCCRDDLCIEQILSKCYTTTHNSTIKAPSTTPTTSSSSVSSTTTPPSTSTDTFTATLKETVSTSTNTQHVNSPTIGTPMMSSNVAITTDATVSPTSDTSQSLGQRTCKVCGDYGNGIPCDIRSIYLGPKVQCEAGTDFCMTDIIHDGSGNERVFKRCVNETVCRTKWLLQTSDQDHCIQFGKVLVSGAYSCHFCCISNECNQGLLPDSTTLYTRR